MTPAIFTEDVVEFLIHSGWRQFLLDEQFNFSPPCTALAELYNIDPKTLENDSFLNIFSPADQEKLHDRRFKKYIGKLTGNQISQLLNNIKILIFE